MWIFYMLLGCAALVEHWHLWLSLTNQFLARMWFLMHLYTPRLLPLSKLQTTRLVPQLGICQEAFLSWGALQGCFPFESWKVPGWYLNWDICQGSFLCCWPSEVQVVGWQTTVVEGWSSWPSGSYSEIWGCKFSSPGNSSLSIQCNEMKFQTCHFPISRINTWVS